MNITDKTTFAELHQYMRNQLLSDVEMEYQLKVILTKKVLNKIAQNELFLYLSKGNNVVVLFQQKRKVE